MNDLIEKLKIIALRAKEPDASTLEAAIDRLEELEAKMSGYEEDATDWQVSVVSQMRRRKDD